MCALDMRLTALGYRARQLHSTRYGYWRRAHYGQHTPMASSDAHTVRAAASGTAAPSSSVLLRRDDIVLGSAASAWQFNSRGDTVRAKRHGDDATSATSSSDDTGPDDSSVEIPSDTDDYKNEEAGYLPDLRGRGLYRAAGGTALSVPYVRLASPSSASGSSDHAGVPPLVNSGITELASTTDTVSMKRTNLIDAIKAGAFGSKATAIVAVTEFQKKSLPHVHILVPAHSNAEADACAHGDHVAAKPSEPEDTRTIAVAAAH